MNKANLKSYAPQARKDFIAAVTARANQLGLSVKSGSLEVVPAQSQGDVTVIAGQAWPAKVNNQRDQLIERIRKDGFEHTMDAVAYTWFNRFAALRYMELHDYLGHGHRALSSSAGGMPDILTYATDLANDLPGLNAAKVTELKLAGNRDGELYRMLLVAQCNALSRAMPFLFERIDDDSELLLPDNLLRSDSVIATLVEAIPEEDWAEVEIIGWLYQFYISEKKDQVIGKVVKSEDIPAATQLFTPNWIVQYLVQNSVGRLWLMANPQSSLAQEWPYYITPAMQTPEVQAELDALIQTRVSEDGDTLNPESITVLDPACGSGHILVVAYEVLKAIYLERGYQPRAIPRLILEKNLYGIDIDDRAAQMAGFALLMKARADDRRLFSATDDAGNLQPPKLNVLSLQESKGMSVDELTIHLAPFKVHRATITALVDTFEHAKTFGSLIQIPHALKTQLAVLPQVLALVKQGGDMYATAAADDLLPLVEQALVLSMQFDGVVANPPYMGNKYLTPALRSYLKQNYDGFEKDLFSAFILRDCHFAKPIGQLGFMSPFVWMFISSYEDLRNLLINEKTITSLVQLEYSGFDGATVPICAFTFSNNSQTDYLAGYIRLSDFRGAENQSPKTLEAIANPDCGWFYKASSSRLKRIPGNPIAYWLSDNFLSLYKNQMIGNVFDVKEGVGTRNDDVFMKMCWEVPSTNIGRDKRWILTDKAGDFKKWYMGPDFLMDWEDDGRRIKNYRNPDGSLRSRPQNLNYLFKEAISWGLIGSGVTSFRWRPAGYGFVSAAPSLFGDSVFDVLAQMNSKVVRELLKVRGATLNMTSGVVSEIPFFKLDSEKLHETKQNSEKLVSIAKEDWDSKETAWDFSELPYFNKKSSFNRLKDSFNELQKKSNYLTNLSKELEERNNQIFIDCYGLGSEVTPTVPLREITLNCNPAYRYGGDKSNDELIEMVRYDTMRELVSYIIGCMMGRYSLDEPGLIYARMGNVDFDPSRYATFPADSDGIVPITDELWFADDACTRICEFLRNVWGADTLLENTAWLADSLGTKASETPEESIRRYVADKFFKDHLQTYKKRPIYWLFSSGKQGAFQALVYLHRYSEGTLARLRAEYVVPLTGKMQSRIEMLQKDAVAAISTTARNKLAKEVEKLKKKHAELLAYDEQLRHYADMRITLDLDDGVKVNYGKFGDLLAEVKAVTGGASDN